MRRYNQTTAYGGTTTYLHDQHDVAQSNNLTGQTNTINNYLTMPGTGEVLAYTTTGGTYVPLHDRLGSALGLVNSSNSLQTQYTYEPFGNVTTSGQASAYPYLFAGMELDSSGLYHTQTRYYSPTFGRFLSADAGMPVNAFSYADDDPVNAIDPSGMSPEYVSGATGMSPPPDDAIGAGDAHNGSGGLGGTILAQSMCDYGDCAHLSTLPSPEPGSWIADLVDFFVGLFGGGGGQPTFVPRGYRRVAHYPAMYFITDSEAQLEEYTPDLKQKSDNIEILTAVVTPAQIDSPLDGASLGGGIIRVGGSPASPATLGKSLIPPIIGDLARRGITGPRETPYWMKPPNGPAKVIPLNRFEPWEAPAAGLVGPAVGIVTGAGLMILTTPTETGCQPGIETCAPGYKP